MSLPSFLTPFRKSVDKLSTTEELEARIQQLEEREAQLQRVFDAYAFLIKPVLDVGNVSKPVVIPFDNDTLTGQDITFSSSTFARFTPAIGGTTYYSVDEHAETLANEDNGQILHEGNDTQFDRLYMYIPEMDLNLYKLCFDLAFGVNVSAYTSGNITLTSVRTIIYTIGNNNTQNVIFDRTWNSGLGALSGTGSQMFIIDDDIGIDAIVQVNQPLIIRMITTVTKTGTATTQEGIIPWFPYQANSGLGKSMARNELVVHTYPQISNADRALRRQQSENRVDFSGVDGFGVKRGLA